MAGLLPDASCWLVSTARDRVRTSRRASDVDGEQGAVRVMRAWTRKVVTELMCLVTAAPKKSDSEFTFQVVDKHIQHVEGVCPHPGAVADIGHIGNPSAFYLGKEEISEAGYLRHEL